jgi:DNA-binding MarR family transcriptional regulator
VLRLGLKDPTTMNSTTPQQTPTGAALVALLGRHGGRTDASNETLAGQLGCSLSALKKALQREEDAGRVFVSRRRRNSHEGDPTGRTIYLAGGAQ